MTNAQEPGGGVGGADLDADAAYDELDDDELDDGDLDDDELDDDELDDDELDDDELDDDELDDDELDDDELEDDDLDDDLEYDEEDEPGHAVADGAAEYEAGDVNTISAPPARSGASSPTKGDMPVAVLEYVARAMADDPGAVVVQTELRRGSTVLRLHVAPHDMGRIIGRRGRTAQAIRTLVGVAGARDGVRTVVDIADD
ncbi:MAG: KH domain-containing protein [Actinomycetota bacterium]|jgi:predicted RNA-binding protein YlqC (UPF0109 family)|nr:KH domain-containing protein [Actinomycetota bacterium]